MDGSAGASSVAAGLSLRLWRANLRVSLPYPSSPRAGRSWLGGSLALQITAVHYSGNGNRTGSLRLPDSYAAKATSAAASPSSPVMGTGLPDATLSTNALTSP
jgi:hypothetical protein